jgi:hypothetical protein
MQPGRFSFGDPAESRPQRKNAWFARAVILAILCALAIVAHWFDVEWLRR